MSTREETIANFIKFTGGKKYATIYADPPWRFANRTGKMAPENKKLTRYPTMELADILALPVGEVAAEKSHLYLWVPNALIDNPFAQYCAARRGGNVKPQMSSQTLPHYQI